MLHPSEAKLICRGKVLGIVDIDLDIKVVLLIKYSAFIEPLGKTGNTVRQFITYLLT
jgi:hypothetical protein